MFLYVHRVLDNEVTHCSNNVSKQITSKKEAFIHRPGGHKAAALPIIFLNYKMLQDNNEAAL